METTNPPSHRKFTTGMGGMGGMGGFPGMPGMGGMGGMPGMPGLEICLHSLKLTVRP